MENNITEITEKLEKKKCKACKNGKRMGLGVAAIALTSGFFMIYGAIEFVKDIIGLFTH